MMIPTQNDLFKSAVREVGCSRSSEQAVLKTIYDDDTFQRMHTESQSLPKEQHQVATDYLVCYLAQALLKAELAIAEHQERQDGNPKARPHDEGQDRQDGREAVQ